MSRGCRHILEAAQLRASLTARSYLITLTRSSLVTFGPSTSIASGCLHRGEYRRTPGCSCT
jgi:hypothetical protein